MAQVEMTVSMDSRRQEQIDRFCAISGLSIPWIEFLEKEEQRRKAREGFNAIRAKAERGEYPDLTMEEINEEIAKARAEKRQKENQG